jgi:hypothetical protein
VSQGDGDDLGLGTRPNRQHCAGADEDERERPDEFGRTTPECIHQHGRENK